MPEPHEYCRGCDVLVEPQREGEPYSCYRGGDDKPLVELEADENGHPLRSAACLADNPPLLTREEFLAAVREECIGAELALPEQELVGIGRIRCRRAREFSRMFVRLRDDLAAIPILSPPTGPGIAFVGEANWGLDAAQIVEAAIEQARHDLDSLQRLLAGLGEPGPGETD